MSSGISKMVNKMFSLVRGFIYKILCTVMWPPLKCSQMIVNTFVYLADYLLDKAKTAAQKAILLWLLFVSLLVIAILSYLAFLNTYVPTAEITKPVHLSFSVCSNGVGICSFPSANVSFWNDEGTRQDFLGAGQAYSMMLTLEVPESPRNRDLGMFVVAVKMFDRNGIISSTSERSIMLRYASIITRIVDFVGFLPLYFFGFKEHTQTLQVLMFPHLVDDYYHPSVGAFVEIRSHGIEIYSCMLTLSAKFTGLKYYLYYWPITSALCALGSNMTIFALALGLTIYKRSSDIKVLAATLDLAKSKKGTKKRLKEGYEEGAAEGDTENVKMEGKPEHLTTSGTQTKPSGINKEKEEEKEDMDICDIPLVQEPVDFIPEGEEVAMGVDLAYELRQRRIN